MKTLLTITALLIVLTTSAQQHLTSDQRTYWNGYVTFLEAKGLKGSTLLDNKVLGRYMFNQYSKGTVNYTVFVTLVQADIAAYRANALKQIHEGKVTFGGKDEDFMKGLSIIDGWAGSRTTSYRFPSEVVIITNEIGKHIGTKINNLY